MSDRLSELGQDTEVVLITFTTKENLGWYQEANEVPFPILVDRDRAGYRAFGLGRGSTGRIYGWRATRRYLELFRSAGPGRRPDAAWLRELLRPSEDTLQLGGDFVVDADGSLAYGFWGEGPDDRPTVDELIEAVRGIGTSLS